MYIEMTQAQAEAVSGTYVDGYELKPFEFEGKWYLPADILSMDVYAEAHAILGACSIIDSLLIEGTG